MSSYFKEADPLFFLYRPQINQCLEFHGMLPEFEAARITPEGAVLSRNLINGQGGDQAQYLPWRNTLNPEPSSVNLNEP